MSLLKKLAGETAIYGLSSILGRLLQFVILTPYLTRVFGRAEYGDISVLYTYAAILTVLFTYRMETAFFRFGSRDEGIERTFSTASGAILTSTGILAMLMLIAAEPLADLIRYPGHSNYIRLLAGIVAMDALAAIPFARLRLENRPYRFAGIRILNIVVNIITLFLLLEAGKGASWFREEDRVAYVLLANLCASTFTVVQLLPLYRKMKIPLDGALLRRMLQYAWPLVIVGLAAVVNQLIGQPMLQWLLPEEEDMGRAQAGIFSAASKIAVLMNLFTQAFNYAAEPFFFRNAGRDDAKQIYADVAMAFTIVGCLGFLGIWLYLDLIQYLLGDQLRAGLDMAPILLMANLFLGLYYNFSIWFKLTDRTIMGAYLSVAGSVVTILINLWLIPRYGYYGPAWAALACYGLMAAGGYLLGRRLYPIPYAMSRMLLYIAFALSIYVLSRWIYIPQLAPRLVVHTLLLGSFLALVWVRERHLLKRS